MLFRCIAANEIMAVVRSRNKTSVGLLDQVGRFVN